MPEQPKKKKSEFSEYPGFLVAMITLAIFLSGAVTYIVFLKFEVNGLKNKHNLLLYKFKIMETRKKLDEIDDRIAELKLIAANRRLIEELESEKKSLEEDIKLYKKELFKLQELTLIAVGKTPFPRNQGNWGHGDLSKPPDSIKIAGTCTGGRHEKKISN